MIESMFFPTMTSEVAAGPGQDDRDLKTGPQTAEFVPAPRARGQGRDHARRRAVRSNADVVVVGRLL